MEEFSIGAWLGHAFSTGAILGAIKGIFPPIAVVLAIIWYMLQIYESHKVQTWLGARRLRRIAKLKLEQERLEAIELVLHPKNRVDILPAKIAAAELLEDAKAEAKLILEEARKVGATKDAAEKALASVSGKK
jgi:hypothetical protein